MSFNLENNVNGAHKKINKMPSTESNRSRIVKIEFYKTFVLTYG